jgi:hypothetical protein
MSRRQVALKVSRSGRLLALPVLLLLLMAGAALAQQQGAPPPVPTIDPRAAQRDMSRREMLLRGLGGDGEQTNDRQVQAAIDQIKQDFKRIQIIRNEMIDYLTVQKPFDYKLVAEHTAEIRKRAARLQSALPLYHPEDEQSAQAQPQQPPVRIKYPDEQMKEGLVQLCNLIFKFTTNPIFKNPGAIDIQQSARASRDLKSIVDLSTNIRKSAERLGHTAKQP